MDDDVIAQAEQALATVDSDFGRTTDPVRMYMREMGTVDLLTRESEIEIARRIEDGLKHMVQAIAACPPTIAALLAMVDKVERDEMNVDDLVDGLIDYDIGLDNSMALEVVEDYDDEEDDNEDGAKAAAISAEALAKLKEEVIKRFAIMHVAHKKMTVILPVRGSQDPEYQALLAEILEELTAFRFSPKQVEGLCVLIGVQYFPD